MADSDSAARITKAERLLGAGNVRYHGAGYDAVRRVNDDLVNSYSVAPQGGKQALEHYPYGLALGDAGPGLVPSTPVSLYYNSVSDVSRSDMSPSDSVSTTSHGTALLPLTERIFPDHVASSPLSARLPTHELALEFRDRALVEMPITSPEPGFDRSPADMSNAKTTTVAPGVPPSNTIRTSAKSLRGPGTERRSRKQYFNQLFTNRRASHSGVPFAISKDPSDVYTGFPPETKRVHLRPSAEKGRLEVHTNQPTIKNTDDHMSLRTKNNVWRPPKGTKNWFDAFDVSSDEDDDQTEATSAMDAPVPKDMTAHPYIPLEPQELPADEISSHGRAPATRRTRTLSSPRNFSTHRISRHVSHPHRSPDGYAQTGAHSDQHTDEAGNPYSDRHGSIGLTSMSSAMSSSGYSSARESRLDGSSVYTLGDTALASSLYKSGDGTDMGPTHQSRHDEDRVYTHDATAVGTSEPVIATQHIEPYDEHTDQSAPLQDATFISISDSPMVLSDAVPKPLALNRDSLNSSDAIIRVPRPFSLVKSDSSRSQSSQTLEYGMFDQGASGHFTNGDSQPQASHVMLVSDEELVWLEMMRQKRAVMEQTSFTEEYQQVMRREQEDLIRRRYSAQRTALQILQLDEMPAEATAERADMIENMISEHAEQQRKITLLRQENVDRALRLERYLAQAANGNELYSDVPSRASRTTLGSSRDSDGGRIRELELESPQPDVWTLESPIEALSRPRSSPAAQVTDSTQQPLPSEPDLDDPIDAHKQVRSDRLRNGSRKSLPIGIVTKRSHLQRGHLKDINTPSPVEEEVLPIPERNPNRRPATSSGGSMKTVSGLRLSSCAPKQAQSFTKVSSPTTTHTPVQSQPSRLEQQVPPLPSPQALPSPQSQQPRLHSPRAPAIRPRLPGRAMTDDISRRAVSSSQQQQQYRNSGNSTSTPLSHPRPVLRASKSLNIIPTLANLSSINQYHQQYQASPPLPSPAFTSPTTTPSSPRFPHPYPFQLHHRTKASSTTAVSASGSVTATKNFSTPNLRSDSPSVLRNGGGGGQNAGLNQDQQQQQQRKSQPPATDFELFCATTAANDVRPRTATGTLPMTATVDG